MTENREPNMNDTFDIRVQTYPETPEMAPLYSLWKGQTPITCKMPLRQAMEHLQEYLESLADNMAAKRKEDTELDEIVPWAALLTKELYEAINRVRQDAATHKRCIWNLGIELQNELWEYVQLQWDDDEMWQRRYWDTANDPDENAMYGGEDPLPPPEPKAAGLREYLGIVCRGMEKILSKKVEEYEAKEAAEKEEDGQWIDIDIP